MHCININLTVYSFTFNTDCIKVYKLVYMIVIHYRNKMLYNRVICGTNSINLFKILGIHRTHVNFNNVNYGV